MCALAKPKSITFQHPSIGIIPWELNGFQLVTHLYRFLLFGCFISWLNGFVIIVLNWIRAATTTATIDRFQVNKQKYDALFFRLHTTRSAWMYVNRELAACTNVLHSDFWISVRYSKAMFTRCVVTISYICIVCAHFRGKCPFECLHICIYSASDV